MAKHEKLRELLKSYLTELGALTTATATGAPWRHRQRTAVNIIERNIIDLFDKIERERDGHNNVAIQNLKAFEQMQRERDDVIRLLREKCEQSNRSFNLEAAKRGEPIEVLFNGNWIDATFVGVARGLPVLDSLQFDTTPSTWPVGQTIRMKSREVTMYANIYRHPSGRFNIGSLYETPNEARHNSDSKAVVNAVPVTFTVAE
jgi:hypothetical protein